MSDTWSEEHRALCEARFLNSMIPHDRMRFIFKCRQVRSPEAVDALLAKAEELRAER